MITILNKFTKEQILKEYNQYILSGGHSDNISSFETFLALKDWSTNHAEDVYNFLHSGNFEDLTSVNDIRIRKDHPVRDWLIKKGGITTLFVAGLGFTVFGSIAAAITGGASTFLGMPLLDNAVVNFINFAVPGGLAGGLLYTGFRKAKDAITRSSYNKKYGATKNLNQLALGKSIEKTKIADLVNLINSDNEKIYKLREGKWFTAPFRFAKRHALNIKNRNRMHQFAKTFEDLLDQYYVKMNDEAPTDTDKYNDTELKNIVKMLEYMNEAYANDITTSKLFTLLNCKEEGKHKHTVEGLDIWSKLAILSNAVENANGFSEEVLKEVEKDCKNMKKDKDVYNTAREKFNVNPNLLQHCVLNRYYNLGAPIAEPVEFVFGAEDEIDEPFVEPIVYPEPITEEEVIEEETIVIEDSVIIEPIAVEEDVDETTKPVEEEIISDEFVEEVIEEETVSETPDEEVAPVVEENLLRRSQARLQAKVKVEELARGNKATITNMQDNSKETIKVTSTPSGSKINVEVKKADGTVLKTSHKNTSDEIDVEVKRILQETALNSGVDLQQLNLI